MSKTFLFITPVLLSQFFMQTLFAQAADSEMTESEFLADLPVVLTATRLEQSKKNSPTATTIIDREMIEASGFTEIADLLRLAPGMLVNYDSGHIANAGYQFLFDRYRVRLQVLVDGMSVYTPSFGEMPWTQLGITIDDIERIEIIRGPSSASYGPNAMTGVISIITRHAALDSGARFKLTEGANGRSEQFVSYGAANGDFDYKISIGARKDDGFEKRYDGKDLSIANLRGDYQLTDNDVLTFSLQYNTGDYQEDSTPTLNDSMPEHLKHVQQTSWQTKWVHNYANGDIFTLNYYQQSFDDQNNYLGDFTSDGYGFVPIDEGFKTRRENLEANYSILSELYTVSLGVLYRLDNATSAQYLYDVDKDIDTRQAYVNTEVKLSESNVINLGLLYDNNDTGGETTSPRVAWNHHFNTNHSARLSYAESTRSPFVLEEYTNRVVYVPDFMINVSVWSDLIDLEPEKIKTVDLGYIGNLNNNTTEIDIRIYKSELSDLIVQDWTLLTGGFLQGDEFNISGLEATVSHQFDKTRAIINYARIKIEAGDLAYGDPGWYETGAPSNSASMLLMHDFGNRLSGAVGYYYTSEYQQLCCETDQQDSRQRLDLTVTRSFKLHGHQSKLKLVLQNITDEKVETRLYNDYQRQGYVSFSMEL